jgi:hypothetical protein
LFVDDYLISNTLVYPLSLTDATNLNIVYPSPTPSPHKQNTSIPLYSPGELGKLANTFALEMAQMGWDRFVYH